MVSRLWLLYKTGATGIIQGEVYVFPQYIKTTHRIDMVPEALWNVLPRSSTDDEVDNGLKQDTGIEKGDDLNAAERSWM